MEALSNQHSSDDEDDGSLDVTTATSLSGTQVVVVTSPKVPWDPMTSSDWDKEKPSAEAIIRIKGYVYLVAWCIGQYRF